MVTNRLKEIRKDKSLSLEEVGKGVGLATNTISRYETGKREPKLETWLKLAEFFNVSVSYLQGLTISENDVLKIMNEAYLSDVEEFLTLQNKSQKFDYVSFIKTNNNFNISHSIDMY
ncbi:helix-turn-helix domain-containing protein, partial [Lactobacillus helveticus]